MFPATKRARRTPHEDARRTRPRSGAGRLPGGVLVPRLPRRELRRPAAARSARRSPSSRRRTARRRRFLDHRRAPRPLRRAAERHYVERLRPVPQARALPVLLDRRRHPPPRRGAGRVQGSATAPAASSSTPTASCPTTCRGAGVRRRSPTPTAGERCCRSYRPSLELLRLALAEDGTAVRRGGRRGLRDPARRLAGGPRPRCRRWPAAGPPSETVGLEPYDPRLLPSIGRRR